MAPKAKSEHHNGAPKAREVHHARFRIRHGDQEIQVLRPCFVIGRSAGCELVLQGGLVSRRHAQLTDEGDVLFVADLGSRNGVLVNQRRIVEPVRVGHGDVIGIGLETLEVIDMHVAHRSEALSTLPPPPPRETVPFGEADVDVGDVVTVAAQLEMLSVREREVFELIVLGHTQREIAEKLHVSVKTIESHRARVAEKLECRTRADLVSYAISAGILRGR